MLTLLLIAGLLASLLSSFFACYGFLLGRRGRSRRERCLEASGSSAYLSGGSVSLEGKGISRWLISDMAKKSLLPTDNLSGAFLWRIGMKDVDALLEKAGLVGLINQEGVILARRNLSILFSALGLLVGLVFSELLAMVLFLAGFLVGWCAPLYAVRREKEARTNAVESDLARMLEVVVLGLRGGLSFDRALAYFCEFFDCSLSRSCSVAQTQWSHGLLSREEALKSLASSYDSKLVSRAISSINRSLRYGTSLADDLTSAAASARAQRRARLEEQIAKAPVKMLLPVGALMLPAMLILVVGPILLELMGEL